MNNTRKIVLSALLIAIGVALPQAFHAIPNAGSIFLPMHIPVLVSGFLVGPSVYATYAYSNDIIRKFSISTRKAFRSIKRAIDEKNVPLLSPEPRSDAFKRLVY